MSRIALGIVQHAAFAAMLSLAPGLPALGAGQAINPHMDFSQVSGSCSACHSGHGASRSPMLPSSQKKICLTCHDTQEAASKQLSKGRLSASAAPTFLSDALSMPNTHPVDEDAFSRDEPGVVTCTSCHSPHRGKPQDAASVALSGLPRRSPRNPTRMEYEMCEKCHGSDGATTEDLTDLSRMLYPGNRSFHPVEAPSPDSSPSLLPSLSGRQINCTDCHGNGNRSGSRGLHGSPFRHLLGREYATTDGSSEAENTYALCYTCHDRKKVLDGSPFPLHRLHVVEAQASCASCHNAHGSVSNRALIRFGEETSIAVAAPSPSTGELFFVSQAQGSGSCSLTCHGVDHPNLAYGGLIRGGRDSVSTAAEEALRSRESDRRARDPGTALRRDSGGRVREDPPL